VSYEKERLRRILASRIYKHSRRAGEIRSGEANAPSGKNPRPVSDITGYGYLGFAMTGGDAGGFNTNPEGEV
jgi:hypothetical protein